LYAFVFSPMRVTCSFPTILLNFIFPIFNQEYKLCSSSLWSFLQPPVTSSLLGPNTLVGTLLSLWSPVVMSHLLKQSVTNHFVFICFVWFSM
jgi:hypothetical protein